MAKFYLRYNPAVMRPTTLSIFAGVLLALLGSAGQDAKAVRLDPEAGGQALIYPYYTVRSYGTDPFNTYLSIVNTSADGKALKVRFREGREGKATLDFNLFLSPNDTWTGALVPSNDGGTQLITTDASCVSPLMPEIRSGVRATFFRNLQFPNDALDRTREGYAEVIEMGTLHGATLAAITQDASGIPQNCAAVQGASFVPPAAELGLPSGGLQGTLTLINVASGMDFTVNAEALADFTATAQPGLYSAPGILTPDLSYADPVSVITTPTHAYRLQWSNGLDAVSSVLMRAAVINEYILDKQTASSSDWVITFPTRFALVGSVSARAPFGGSSGSGVGCEQLLMTYFNREAAGASSVGAGFPEPPPGPPPLASCNASTVWNLTTYVVSPSPPPVFGSANGASGGGLLSPWVNGWGGLGFIGTGPTQGLVSLAGSSRVDLRTGAMTTGPMKILGLPVTGFMARTFLNGLLSCSSGTCQGSYGSAFPYRSSRSISPSP